MNLSVCKKKKKHIIAKKHCTLMIRCVFPEQMFLYLSRLCGICSYSITVEIWNKVSSFFFYEKVFNSFAMCQEQLMYKLIGNFLCNNFII